MISQRLIFVKKIFNQGFIKIQTATFRPSLCFATNNDSDPPPSDKDETGTSSEGQGKEIGVITSSLRVDAVAAMGLNISRKAIWELSLDGMIYLNGSKLQKKSTKVEASDVIEVDQIVKNKKTADEEVDGLRTIKRGRVVVKEIGPQTRKGKHRIILIRYKHYKLYKDS